MISSIGKDGGLPAVFKEYRRGLCPKKFQISPYPSSHWVRTVSSLDMFEVSKLSSQVI